MVVSVGPGKFYGSSLPRPHFVKLNSERVDPPLPIMEPLLSWANEAHWSMGGLSFKRQRLQGKIEGNIGRLRSHREKELKRKANNPSPPPTNRKQTSISPPLAKRRRLVLMDDDDDDGVEAKGLPADTASGKGSSSRVLLRRKFARKLSDEFDKVACSSDESVKKRGNEEIGLKKKVTNTCSVNVSPKLRTSPRFPASA